jgi:hypothetical protein
MCDLIMNAIIIIIIIIELHRSCCDINFPVTNIFPSSNYVKRIKFIEILWWEQREGQVIRETKNSGDGSNNYV